MEASHNIVTKERKQDLYVEAIRNRRDWIYSSSPFRPSTIVDPKSFPTLQKFSSSHVSQHLSSALQVLEVLYGMEDNDTHISTGPHLTRYDFDQRMLQNLKTVTQDPSLETTQLLSLDIDKKISQNFYLLLTKLDTPEYSLIVQDIRQFVNGFEQMVTKIQKDLSSKGTELCRESIAPITLTIRKFLEYMKDRFHHQSDWIKTDNLHPLIDYSGISPISQTSSTIEADWVGMKDAILESFIYSKCYKSIALLLPMDMNQQDLDLEEKIQCFRTFIKPEHLDIHHFTAMTGDFPSQPSWDTSLSEPIRLIRIVDCLGSPSLILSYILKIYKSVCSALDVIVAAATVTETNSNLLHSSLPGADEIFPTLLWTILCAQPKHLCTSLSLVDVFIPHEDIRGEVGYAYTNFFSAIQFIRDFNIESGIHDSSGTTPLSISPEELQSALNNFQNHRRANIEANDPRIDLVVNKDEDVKVVQSSLSVHAVREARARGETVNLDWAIQYLDRSSPSAVYSSLKHESPDTVVENSTSMTHSIVRTYPFLHMDAKDIRMSDVPLLLKEYQSLVQVVESLYAEKTNAMNIQRKKDVQRKREELKKEAMDANEQVSSIQLDQMVQRN